MSSFPFRNIAASRMKLKNLQEPLAITMWDFSWLERRWPGAGYEDWDLALDELVERGYNAVRIDAFPHLVATDAEAVWTIIPCWNQQDWGSPARNRIQVQPNLNTFIRRCSERNVHVGLSTWFQRVEELDRIPVVSSRSHSRIWRQLLDSIAAEGLLDNILYVDFCNEWPLDCWAPFFMPKPSEQGLWNSPSSLQWMLESIEELRRDYPDIPYTFSNVGNFQLSENQMQLVSEAFDFLEPHIWMSQANQHEFYNRIGYQYERFESKGYENVALNAQRFYESDSEYWDSLLRKFIDQVSAEADALKLPLITTECWSIVDYKDWPLLDWEWVKRAGEVGIRHAASKGNWIAMATSNFCGPQFRGMWRDKDWHQEMTRVIRSAGLPKLKE